MKSKCDNCENIFRDEQLSSIEDFHIRVEPGNEVPSGECPDCGALCYIIREEKPKAKVQSSVLDRWKFDYCHPHNGEYWHECTVCGGRDWIASYGRQDQLVCKCDNT